MKILYNSSDLLRILKKHHSYSGEPIKVDHTTQDVLRVEICGNEVIVTLGTEDEE